MSEFIDLLRDPNAGFIRNALIAGLMSSIAFGIVGTYVVTRRISAIAGAIAHCVLGGIGAAVYAQEVLGWEWLTPMVGAFAAAIGSALLIGAVTLYAQEREDTLIGAIWAGGMAVGFLFLSKSGATRDLMSYLIGDILIVPAGGLGTLAALDLAIALIGILFYHKFVAVCFDGEFAALRGLHANLWYIGLLCLTAVSIVLLTQLVGIVMVIALLVLPAATSSFFARRMWQMMALACVFCMASTTIGLGASVAYDLPSGPAIVAVAGAAYIAALGGKSLLGAIARRGNT